MYQLPDPAIKAILKEWHPQEYYPPYTDAREWIDSIESLCNIYGIPDAQRLQCAVGFIKKELSTELRRVLEEAREWLSEPVHWSQFKSFLVVFDQDFREQWEQLPFYKKHPKRTAVAVGIGGIVLTGAATIALSYLGLASAGLAAGTTVAAYQSIAYSTAARVLVLSLQSASTTTVTSSVGTILTGAATTGAGVLVATTNSKLVTPASSGLLQQVVESVVDGDKPNGDNNGNPPPYRATAPEECLLTPRAILAIVKSWDVATYDPPRTDCASWLDKVHDVCEQYGIPVKQQAPCASHHMRADCKEAAHAAGCYNMTWNQFAVWLRQYDYDDRKIASGNIAEPFAKELKA